MDPFRLFRSSTQMLMVDVQERLLPAISGHEDIRRNILRLSRASEVLHVPFFYTEQYPKGLGPTDGEILSSLPKGARRFEKNYFSCCDEEGFNDFFELSSPNRIVLFGIETHICILTTLLDLLARGRKVVLAADACGSRAPENAALALKAASAAGALVVPTETIIYQLMGQSGTAEFKTLLPLFKD